VIKGKLIKHDQYIEELKSLISHNYSTISTHVSISDKKRVLGEVDVIAEKNGKVDIFEVKCSYRFYKARQQLKKIKKYMPAPINNCYFYCGNSHLLHLISI
jgi:hypothetical protein